MYDIILFYFYNHDINGHRWCPKIKKIAWHMILTKLTNDVLFYSLLYIQYTYYNNNGIVNVLF